MPPIKTILLQNLKWTYLFDNLQILAQDKKEKEIFGQFPALKIKDISVSSIISFFQHWIGYRK